MSNQTRIPPLKARSTLLSLSAAVALVAAPAMAQVDEATYSELAEIVAGYADDLTIAMPCIYTSGVAFSRTGDDRFDDTWGETAVVETLEDVDDLSDEQRADLLSIFNEGYAPDFAIADIRDLARACHVAEGGGNSIIMQLQLFMGVGIPLEYRLP